MRKSLLVIVGLLVLVGGSVLFWNFMFSNFANNSSSQTASTVVPVNSGNNIVNPIPTGIGNNFQETIQSTLPQMVSTAITFQMFVAFFVAASIAAGIFKGLFKLGALIKYNKEQKHYDVIEQRIREIKDDIRTLNMALRNADDSVKAVIQKEITDSITELKQLRKKIKVK